MEKRKSRTCNPLPPGLPRRPYSAAYGLGPSVFTIPANRKATDRASVSQAVARRGAPPLPARSLGTCRCCLRKQDGCLREGEGSWAWTRRNLVCGRPGSRRRSGAQVGVAVLLPHDSLGAEVQGSTRSTHGIGPPGKTHSPSPPGLGCHERLGARGRRCGSRRRMLSRAALAGGGCHSRRRDYNLRGSS